ncbi:MAG: hypothetical protein EAZ92_07505 [Candidatus Kapaibacterium sp.]|nr:MAG: hypothetical protein EAZ92_07505 [Candidatus Kapabacteria bacterium]
MTAERMKTFISRVQYVLLVPFFMSVFTVLGNAQEKPQEKLPIKRTNTSLEQLLEFLAINAASVPNLDALEYYAAYPLVLQKISASDLEELAVFSRETAERIVGYFRRNPASRLAQLADDLALSPLEVLVLQACTRDKPLRKAPKKSNSDNTQTPLHLWYRARTRFLATPQRGFTPDATASQQFQGSPLEAYQRLSIRYDAPSTLFAPNDSLDTFTSTGQKNAVIEGNITLAKDAGERSIADFTSAYLRTSFGNTHIILGDFLVESGMGTALWSMYGNGKSADVLTPTTQQKFRIVPYRSSTEQQYFRGVAAQTSLAIPRKSNNLANANTKRDSLGLSIKGWYSSQSRAARVDTALGVATSLNFDGLFRTRSELSLVGGLQERVGGLGAELSGTEIAPDELVESAWSLGATAFLLDYDKEIVSRSSQVFFGQRGVNASVYGMLRRGTLLLNAEMSMDGQQNLGGRINAEFAITEGRKKDWEFAASARYFPASFRAPFGVNFGENSKPTNEAGLYAGAVWKGIENLRCVAYLDAYTTITSTATVPVEVRGIDLFTEAVWEASDVISLTARLRHETKTDALTQGTGRNRQRIVFARGKSSLRLHGDFTLSPELRLQSRLEGVLVNFENAEPQETGVLAFVGAEWKPLEQLAVFVRCAGFSTQSFDSALWQYERTIAGTLSNPALFGQGVRAYCLMEAAIIPECLVSLRGAVTRRFDVSTLGSGATQINSNTDAQLLVQVDVKF